MDELNLIKIHEHSEWMERAAEWFHQKWGVPKNDYLRSIEESIEKTKAVPTWYLVVGKDKIIAGCGVIENDFHERKDLTPNVCAVYVEEEYRKRGIARRMLTFVSEDYKKKGIETLYLVTDLTGFYEKLGWNFLCFVEEENKQKVRMHVHKIQ